MLPSGIIIIAMGVTVILCIVTIVLYYHQFVPIHWSFFIAMTIGASVIGWFQYSVEVTAISGVNPLELVPLSRIIRLFVLVSTSLICLQAIIHHRIYVRANGGNE